jgi:hypothetical protein
MACAALACAALFSPALAGDCINYRDYMHWEPPLAVRRAVDILVSRGNQDRAYVATESGLAEVSLIDPAAPALVDTLDYTGGRFGVRAASMALHSGTLWVAAGEAGLIQIATDTLRLIDRIDTPGEPWDIAMAGDQAVIADWDQGLALYDVSTGTPVWLGGRDLPGFAVGVAVDANRAYVVDLVSLTVFDISAPQAPTILNSIALQGQSWDVAIRGELAYVAGSLGLQTVDISDPQHLSLIDTQPAPGRRICLSETEAIVRDTHEMFVLDLNDPHHPQPLLHVNDYGDVAGMAMLDDRLFLAGGDLARVLNLHHGTLAPAIGRILNPNYVEDFALDGVFGCLGGYPGLSIIDLSTPSVPRPRGSVDISNINGVAASGGFAYVLRHDNCVTVDYSNPDLPAVLGQIATIEGSEDCAVEGDRLYVLSDAQGLQVLDISVPSAPRARGTLDIPGSMAAMSAVASRLYIAGRDATGHPRLLIVEASDPDAPQVMGAYEFSGEGSGWSLAANGTRAYMLYDTFWTPARLAIIDVSTPTLPILLGELDIYGASSDPRTLRVAGTTVYVAGEQGVLVIDVTDPASPRIIGTQFDLRSRSVAAGSEYLCGASDNELVVLPLQCTPPAPVELASFAAEPVPGAIRLTWRTAREWDHLGFLVERGLAMSGDFKRLTSTLIQPPGPYTFMDRQVEPGATYYYRLVAVDRSGRHELHGPWDATAGPGVFPTEPPLAYHLAASHPNPFSIDTRETKITFSLANPGHARVRLFDATGRVVATLVDADLTAGLHQASWNGRTARGEIAAAGTYFYQLEAGDFSATRQLVRLR